MKQPKFSQAFFATSLALSFALAPLASHAEMTSEVVRQDVITPESSSALESEVVILKKSLPATQKKIIVREQEELPENEYETVAVQSQSQAQAQSQSQTQGRSTVGSTLDQGIQNKMSDVQVQFENALLRTLDKIKITVDDGADSQSQAQAQSQSQSQAQAPVTIVQDSVVNAQGAPSYLSVDKSAPVDEEEDGVDGETVAKVAAADSILSRVRLSPVLGVTTINSDFYDVDSRYTAGLNIEVDVSDTMSAMFGYSYSQYDIGLGAANPFMMQYQPAFYAGNMQKLGYNQNVFDGSLNLYLFPRRSDFRLFVGGGFGYNLGYLNYKKAAFNTYAPNPYVNMNNQDYEVKSFLGTLQTGAELRLGRNVSIGGIFKYSMVLSSSENQQLNNYAFAMNGYGNSVSQDQMIVGGSLAEDSFYSILGTVKVEF